MHKTKKIEKPWCIYKGISFFPRSIGKVVKESNETNSSYVIYSEGQHFSPQVWKEKYLERFKEISEAINAFAKASGSTYAQIEGKVKDNFPSTFKKDSK